jgi:hypothetical protein
MARSISGYGITTDEQLVSLAHDMGVDINYVGFAEDLPNKAPPGFNIINIGDERIGGSHWVLWYVDPEGKLSIYFDSYGAPPEDDIVKRSPLPLWVNGKQVQRYDEEFCGIWAIVCASVLSRASDKKKAFVEFMGRYEAV